MKAVRQSKILELISKNEIETQEELVNALSQLGFDVTQATVSRDIKELRLTKIPDERGGYKYSSIEKAESGVTPKMKQLFSNTVISITSANNIIVIKTMSGSASTIGAVVDAIKHPSILGSVAGDDNLIIVVSSNDEVPNVINSLNVML